MAVLARLLRDIKRLVSCAYGSAALLRGGSSGDVLKVPVLLYHGFCISEPAGSFMEIGLFEKHVQYLATKYRLTSLRDVIADRHYPKKLRNALVITFDDGYRSNYELAFPVLERYGVPATIFLVTDLTGKVWRDSAVPMLTVGQIQEMDCYGIEFGSHTATHRNLKRLGHQDFKHEVRRSKLDLEQITGRPVVSFAFPWGVYDRGVHIPILKEVGYECAATTVFRPYNPELLSPYEIPRLSIYWYDDVFDLALKCEGYQNWLSIVHRIQALMKTCLLRSTSAV